MKLALPMIWLAGKAEAEPVRERRVGYALVWLWVAVLAACVGVPLLAIGWRSVVRLDGSFAGLAAWSEVLATPGLMQAAQNSLLLAIGSTLLVVPLAFAFAWALVRTCAPMRPLFRQVALVPLLAPSLMPAISLIYLFGNQGLLKDWMGGAGIYGFAGMLAGEVFYTFPHALMIILTALSTADARLYEAATTLGAGRLRQFFTLTLPGARYGVVSAALVVFTLVITDFGVPKIIGGDVSVLAVEVYKQVIGQQQFERGAVIGMLLLLPAVLAFWCERRLAARQQSALQARSVRFRPQPLWWRDGLALLLLTGLSLALLGLLGVGMGASFIRYWPYDLPLTLDHYDFDSVGGEGWQAWFNSLWLAGGTAVVGSVLVFPGAVWAERLNLAGSGRRVLRLLAMLPMAVPGLVLGLGYVFVFNQPGNPLAWLYGSLLLMTVCTVAHFYTTAHLTATTALKQLDPEFEAVAASLKVPFWITFWRVTLPMCLPAVIEVARYFFVSAMTTVSALIFLYSPDSSVAALTILTLDDAGDTAAAAAMATLVVLTSAVVSAGFYWLGRQVRNPG